MTVLLVILLVLTPYILTALAWSADDKPKPPHKRLD